MHKRLTTTLAAGVLALGLHAGTSLAQQAPAQPGATATQQSYSDAQLKKFVAASQQVAMISQEYGPKLQGSADEASRNKIFEEADKKMVGAVHAQGMTVDQFNGINQSIQRDPKLIQRVERIATQ
jgi:hypothetical protein